MSKIDLTERLAQIINAADKDGAIQQTVIARRHAADGMLNSGNFYVAESTALRSIYETTLHALMDHALSVSPPSIAAREVRIASLELETKFLNRLHSILGGSASGNACDAKASETLLSDFAIFARERLLQTVSDTADNVAGKPIRGWRGWIFRYGWNIINTVVAVVALYLSWGKK